MRVTNAMIFNSVVNNLFKNAETRLKLQTNISTGKKINKPSDDPIGSSLALNYRKALSSVDQYIKNIERDMPWLNMTDSILGDMGDSLVRAKELAIAQSSDTGAPEDMKFVATEVRGILAQIIQVANSKIGSNYIFSGSKTSTIPFSSAGIYSGNGDKMRLKIGENDTEIINLPGSDFLVTDLNPDISDKFKITAANNGIVFEEVNGTDITINLTAGTYSGTAMATEIETRLNAAGTSIYTVSYNATTDKFTIASDGAGGILDIEWNNSSAAATLGFNASEDTGSLTYASHNPVGAGYTISSRDVTDRFAIVAGTNNTLQIVENGVGNTDTITLTSTGGESGAALALDVQNRLNAGGDNGLLVGTYSVSYDGSADTFTISLSSGAPASITLTAVGTANTTLGFNVIPVTGVSITSDTAVAFNIITGQNDEFDIAVDSGTVYTIDIDPGIYNASGLVTFIQNGLDSDNGGVLNGLTTVSYASNKFTITSSNSTGINSSIALTSGTDDLLSFLNLDDGFRVNGTDSTPLSDLNRGSGVDTSNPIRITDRRGNTADVTITDQDGSGTITVKDVITLINDVAGLNVIASLNSAGNGINITDTTSSNERIANLKIEEVGGGSAAADLGILADLPYNTIYGTDLDPGVSSYTRISSLKGGQGLTMGSIHIINGPSLVPVTITNGVGANDTLRVIHSTAGAATITLSSGTFSGDKMAEEIGTRLNSNTPLTSGGIIYTVNYDSGINRFTVSANSGTITLDNSVGTADETLGFVFNPVAASSITSNAGDIDLFSGLPAGDLSVGDILDRISNPARINNPNLNITASIDSSLTALDVKSNNSGTTAIVLDNSGTLTSDLGIQGSQNILKTLNAFTEALDRGDRTAVRNILDHLDTGLDKISEKQGDAGARVNRLETTNEGLLDMQLNVTTLLSETEDIDMIKVMTDLMTAQNTYEATLAATAKVMRLTLLNFL